MSDLSHAKNLWRSWVWGKARGPAEWRFEDGMWRCYGEGCNCRCWKCRHKWLVMPVARVRGLFGLRRAWHQFQCWREGHRPYHRATIYFGYCSRCGTQLSEV